MSDAIAALANRFWRVHPKEIQDLGITREQFYEREMRALFATQAAARIEQLEARLDRAVTRGLEQVERIVELEAQLREAFRAGWYINAAVDDQPADYLKGCEEVDWSEYAKASLAPEQDK